LSCSYKTVHVIAYVRSVTVAELVPRLVVASVECFYSKNGIDTTGELPKACMAGFITSDVTFITLAGYTASPFA
jgi:hypothetical protein